MIYNTTNVTEAYKNCKNEQQFKMAWVSLNKRFWKKLWCIETEETVAGFPDVMGIDEDNHIHLFEFKITDKTGRFKFQPTQPAFYRQNRDIPISVVVLNRKQGTLESWIHFKSHYLFDGNLLSVKATATVEAVLGYIHFNNLYDDNEHSNIYITGELKL